MHKLARLLLAVGVTLLAGCATAPAPEQGAERANESAQENKIFVEKQDGTLKHVMSGFLFPTRLGSFERGPVNQYNEQGDDVSVGYNEYSSLIIATLYVYPTHGSSLSEEFARRQNEIANFRDYSNVKLVSTANVTVTPRKLKAMQASYTLTAGLAGKIRPVESVLLVAQQGDWFIEYRISYPAAHHDDALPKVQKLEHTFAWP